MKDQECRGSVIRKMPVKCLAFTGGDSRPLPFGENPETTIGEKL